MTAKLSWLPITTIVVAILTYALFVAPHLSMPSTSAYAIAWLILGAGLILGLHVLAANLDPIEHMVSEYSDVRGYGSLMRSAFFCLAAATLDLAVAIHRFMDPSGVMVWLLVLAGVFTIGMGCFSMSVTAVDEIHTSAFVGSIHNFCASASFSLAILTMIRVAAWPSLVIDSQFQWLRGAALSQFDVAVVTVIIYIILGIGKVKEVRLHTGMRLTALIAQDARKSALGMTPGQTALSTRLSASADSAQGMQRMQVLNHGLGLVERILIFMFLEWEMILAVVLWHIRYFTIYAP